MKAFGFDVRWKVAQPYVTVEDYRIAALKRLPPFVRGYLDGGAEDLVTLKENRDAFSRWSLKAKVLTATGVPDISTVAVGQSLSLPVLLAPTGFSGLYRWESDVAAARAAERRGTRLIASTVSSWSLEEIAEATEQDHCIQLYPREGDFAARLMKRAWAAGYRCLFLTVDSPVLGNRENERRKGMSMPLVLTPWRVLEMAAHPRWLYETLRYRRVSARNLVSGASLSDAAESFKIHARELVQSTLSWDDFSWMRNQWKGRIYLKGVVDAEDATKAVDLGADGIVVSNHGGRQLDFAQSTLAALPPIVAAVGDRAEILLDGGVRRGTDVIKAIALGANAVLIGRPFLYGLTVAGQPGIEHVLDIFRSEITRALTLMGVHSINELDPSWLIDRRDLAAKTGPQHAPSSLISRLETPEHDAADAIRV